MISCVYGGIGITEVFMGVISYNYLRTPLCGDMMEKYGGM